MNGSLIHKKKGHSRLWSQPSDQRTHPRNQHLKQFQFSSIKKGQNDRRLTRSLWPFHDSGVCHSSHNGHYTLSQPSKKTSSHISPQNKDRQEGGKTFSPHKKQQPQSTHAKAWLDEAHSEPIPKTANSTQKL